MEKGKYGVTLAFYGVLGFIFTLTGSTTLLILLTGVVLIGEKNEWATRQALQALMLSLTASIISVAFEVLGFLDWFSWADYGTGLYSFYGVWNRIQTVIFWALRVTVYLFALLGIIKNAKGQEANIPVYGKLANWAYGKVIVKAQPVYVQQPVYTQQPVQQAAPTQQAAPAATCANCGAPLNGGAFCTKCGTPAAK